MFFGDAWGYWTFFALLVFIVLVLNTFVSIYFIFTKQFNKYCFDEIFGPTLGSFMVLFLITIFLTVWSAAEYSYLIGETEFRRIPLKGEFSYMKQKYYDIGYHACKDPNIEVNPPYYLEPYNKAWEEGRRRKTKEFQSFGD